MALYVAEVGVDLVLTVGQLLPFVQIAVVAALRQGHPLTPGDVAVDHEAQGVQYVALERLEDLGHAHGSKLDSLFQHGCSQAYT